MFIKNLLFLIFLLPIFSDAIASPSTIRRIETIQCWEDLDSPNSDLDYSEPCEEIIEYLILDGQENLYGIARTSRALMSGDKNPTTVFFSVPLSNEDQSASPELTLGFLNYVTCTSEDIKSILTSPTKTKVRTDSETSSGDYGVNCLGGKSTSKYVNTSGSITNPGKTSYFLWTPGRCEAGPSNYDINPLAEGTRTKADCISLSGSWIDFIPKKTTTSPGWDLDFVSMIHNGNKFIHSTDLGFNNSPMKIVASKDSWRATNEKQAIGQISSGLSNYIQNYCQNSICEHITRTDLASAQSSNGQGFTQKRRSPNLSFTGGKSLEDFNISHSSRHYSRRVKLWDASAQTPMVSINLNSTQYCTNSISPFNGHCSVDQNSFAFQYLMNALKSATDQFDGGTSGAQSAAPTDQLCPSEIPTSPTNASSSGATMVLKDKDSGVYQGGMDTNDDGQVNVVYGDNFLNNMPDNGGSHHSDHRWYVNPATQDPWWPVRMNNVLWAYLVRQIIPSDEFCPTYPDGENSVIVSGKGYRALWTAGSGYLFTNPNPDHFNVSVSQQEQEGWGMPILQTGNSACYWTYVTKNFFPRVRRQETNTSACGWGYQCPNNSCSGSPTFPIGCKFFRTTDTSGDRSNTCWHHGACGSTNYDPICRDKTGGSCEPKTYDSNSNSAGWCMNAGTWHNCTNPLGDGYARSNGVNWTLPRNFQWCGESWYTKSSCQATNMGGQWITTGMNQDPSKPYYDFSNSCGVISEPVKFTN